MSTAIILLLVAALVGAAIVGGVFFAFSSFIMKALARVPSPEGIRAMQSINITVINRSFLGTFFATALSSIVLGWIAVVAWPSPFAMYVVAGAALYLFGTFAVTIFANVPLNNQLADTNPTDGEATAVWMSYLDRWTTLNTIRTVAALLAVLMYTLGLMQT